MIIEIRIGYLTRVGWINTKKSRQKAGCYKLCYVSNN